MNISQRRLKPLTSYQTTFVPVLCIVGEKQWSHTGLVKVYRFTIDLTGRYISS